MLVVQTNTHQNKELYWTLYDSSNIKLHPVRALYDTFMNILFSGWFRVLSCSPLTSHCWL